MTNIGISLAIIFGTAICSGILWLCWEAYSAKPIRPWDDFADPVNTVPESYAEALQMIPANSDKPIAQFTKWPEVTEEAILNLHGGEQS